MSSLFKMPAMPPPPQLEMPKVADVPSAEDEARRAEEADDMRRRIEIEKVEDLQFLHHLLMKILLQM